MEGRCDEMDNRERPLDEKGNTRELMCEGIAGTERRIEE